MTITSSAFTNNDHIPAIYTCDGKNINPALTFSEIPQEAKSLVLIMDDPDAPSGLFTHWTIYDMSPATLQILENSRPNTGVEGMTSYQKIGYGGPCPPDGTHRYFFRLFALDEVLELRAGASRNELDEAMSKRTIIDQAELLGLYKRETAKKTGISKNDWSEYTDDRNTSDGQLISS